MDKGKIIEIVKQFKEKASGNFNPKEIYLFGSFAKGNPHKDSDIDVALVYDAYEGDFIKDMGELFMISYKIDNRIEPIIVDKKDDISGFLSEIKETGILIN